MVRNWFTVEVFTQVLFVMEIFVPISCEHGAENCPVLPEMVHIATYTIVFIYVYRNKCEAE
jgi:hypothetical protein